MANEDEQLCSECELPATWVRETQFAGRHPFCSMHAREETDFGQEDPSYYFWKQIALEEGC